MTFKILSTSPTFGYYVSEPIEYFKENGCEVTLVPQGKKLSEEELVENMAELDAAIVGVEKITQRVVQGSKRLKVIAKHGAGVDNIDVKTATNQGIVVISAPGANSDAVADLTFGLFLSLARSIPFADHCVREGGWPRIVGIDLSGKTLGIIGLGQIGKKVAKRALGFDMRVLAYEVVKDEDFAQKWGISYRSLDEVLAESDFLSIHVPLIDSTRKLIAKRELQLMKKGAFLVNIARGGVVDEEALYQALLEGKIRGAALDVFLSEPPEGNPLFALDSVIATPHMGGYTTEALRETGMICARGIVDALQGKRPQNIVNPEVLK
ncbi:MAG: phosphoglycerate dehydrogenase [Desulfobacteraceae bacterium]|nr:phosphoglycerate dehydrogenase [Desulfobacteraceae bacterium]